MMRILVADDEIHIRTLLKITLEMVGYEVDVAADGQEALERIAVQVPDLILLDIKMPKLNGWQVCEKIKNDDKTRSVPIIMVTAFGQKEARQRSFDLGADEFISKPFETPALLDAVKKLLERPRPASA
ncbi:MAG: hypothetical protein A2901_04240 [Elusimicrobia bacterium RIFCSPLOWO2_01_FULL_54_10]|nr:MAG: hypothetical protein A2901_04240 [Elusimicrobia bacterium RIFCSPLOWO2_01_FULL_54_10]